MTNFDSSTDSKVTFYARNLTFPGLLLVAVYGNELLNSESLHRSSLQLGDFIHKIVKQQSFKENIAFLLSCTSKLIATFNCLVYISSRQYNFRKSRNLVAWENQFTSCWFLSSFSHLHQAEFCVKCCRDEAVNEESQWSKIEQNESEINCNKIQQNIQFLWKSQLIKRCQPTHYNNLLCVEFRLSGDSHNWYKRQLIIYFSGIFLILACCKQSWDWEPPSGAFLCAQNIGVCLGISSYGSVVWEHFKTIRTAWNFHGCNTCINYKVFYLTVDFMII